MSTSQNDPVNGSSTTLEVASLSHTGLVRTHNEDRCAVVEPPVHAATTHGALLLVADGLGGHRAGEQASEMVVSMLPPLFFRKTAHELGDVLCTSIEEVNRAVFRKSEESAAMRGMGSTVAAAAVRGNTLVIANVGDSRVYLLRDGKLRRLSTDHIIYRNLFSFMDGARAKEPRAILTQALGPRPQVVPSVWRQQLAPGDVLLLCSDGLTGLVDDSKITSVLEALPPGNAAKTLVDLANEAGGHDNITVVVARVLQLAAELPAPVKILLPHHSSTSN